MNHMHVAAYLVNRATCSHPECTEMRAQLADAWRLRRMNLVTQIERQLARCPDAQKEDDHETRTVQA